MINKKRKRRNGIRKKTTEEEEGNGLGRRKTKRIGFFYTLKIGHFWMVLD